VYVGVIEVEMDDEELEEEDDASLLEESVDEASLDEETSDEDSLEEDDEIETMTSPEPPTR
jgi:hypothetical protein